MSGKLTRRKFLKAAGAGAAWVALTNATGCEPDEQAGRSPKAAPSAQPRRAHTPKSPPVEQRDVWTFRTRPDLSPPAISVSTQARGSTAGYIFVAPKKGDGQYGPLILDERGNPVWFRPLDTEGDVVMDFKVQRYQGEPVITWAEGRVVGGHGLDEYVIADRSYREITRVRAVGGYQGDHHEFLITPQDTALITIYSQVNMDLSALGGRKDGAVLDGVIQEIDIATGALLFEWHSLDHVGLEESYAGPADDAPYPFDYFHINSIEVDYDDQLLVSARRTSTVYKIDRTSGAVLWRLGGERSDFEMGPGAQTRYQHDARRQPDGTITIFDNGGVKLYEQSRGVVISLDGSDMSATLAREYTHPDKILAATQGNVQALPNGNVFMGWGDQPVFSEFSNEGDLLFSASFPPQVESYRAFRFAWIGRPDNDPAIAAERELEDEITVYASWNGATEVATWRVLSGPGPGRLKPVGTAPRNGFETVIAIRAAEPFVSVEAVNRSGRVLGASRTLELANQPASSRDQTS